MLKKTLISSAAAAALALGGAAFAQSPSTGSSSGSSTQTQTPPRSPSANENSRGAAPGLENRTDAPRGSPGSERAQERTGTSGSGATTTTQSKPGAGGKSGEALTTGQVPKVQITNEQRTQLRTQIQKANIRTVTREQLNVSVAVGAALPSTVTFVPLPDAIVTIVPQFRGYHAVRVGDQILIVEPGTRRIVYILEA
jgi:hypothetical protein